MRVVLEIVAGPSVGRKIEFASGQSIQVGRASWAELSLPNDDSMAGVHFSLICEEKRCLIRAVHWTHATFLNELKVRESQVYDNDKIVAGGNTFAIHVERGGGAALKPPATAAPSPLPAPSSPAAVTKKPAGEELVQNLLGYLRTQQPLFAILDAARDENILPYLRESDAEYQSLYEDEEDEELAEVAPYLARMPPVGNLLSLFVEQGWGHSWGLLLHSTASFKEVRQHLRRYLTVQLPDGEEAYFRFYDPRVLRPFLPACTSQEVSQFFGPVAHFFVEAEDPSILLDYTSAREGVRQRVVIVTIGKPELMASKRK